MIQDGEEEEKTLENHVLFEKKGSVALITLNRPKKLNALNREMIDEILSLLRRCEEDRQVKLIFLEGSGDRAFSAGGDVMAVYDMCLNGKVEEAVDAFRAEYEMDYYLSDYSKPVISYMDGITMGGGVGISIGTDFRIVTENTRWAMPEMKIGLFPDVGVSYYTSKMEDGFGMYLSLTSKTVGADDCVFLGVADYKVDSSDYPLLKEEILDFSWEKLNRNEVTATVDDIIRDYSREAEKGYLEENRDDIRTYFDKEDLNEIIASLQADTDKPFAQKALESIGKNSPTSMAVTLEQLNRAKHMYLKECFEQDLVMVKSFLRNKDFFEGVKNKLIDKTDRVEWTPKALSLLKKSVVESYFEE